VKLNSIKYLLFNIDYYIDSLYLGEKEYKNLSIFIFLLSSFAISLYKTFYYSSLPLVFIETIITRFILLVIGIGLIDIIMKLLNKNSNFKIAMYWGFSSGYPLIIYILTSFYKYHLQYANIINSISSILSWSIFLYGLSKIYKISFLKIILLITAIIIIISILIGILAILITTEFLNQLLQNIYAI